MTIRGVAHRGYPRKFPENTLVSFQAALDYGYSHVEFDVQLSKDGVPVVIHDTSVDRVTNGTGLVKDLTLEELRRLRVGGTEQIPTLEETLDLLKDRIVADIELKQMGDLYPGLEEAVLNMLKEKGMREQSIITSFDHYSIQKVRQLDKDIQIGLINHGTSPALFPFMKEIDCRILSVKYQFITGAFLRQCEEEGILLIPYQIDHEPEISRFVQYPSVLICTNELEKWAAKWQAVSR
jgi:glycerophosphoryl diester phosphodiesterase